MSLTITAPRTIPAVTLAEAEARVAAALADAKATVSGYLAAAQLCLDDLDVEGARYWLSQAQAIQSTGFYRRAERLAQQ